MDVINRELKKEISRRLVDADSTPTDLSVNPEFLLGVVWSHLNLHTKELLQVPGCCWYFGQSARNNQISPLLLIRYPGKAYICHAPNLGELAQLCNTVRAVTGVSQIQVVGVDNSIRCCFDDYSKSWIHDSLPLPSDWQEEAHG